MIVKARFREGFPVTSALSDLAEDDWDEIGMERSEMLGNIR